MSTEQCTKCARPTVPTDLKKGARYCKQCDSAASRARYAAGRTKRKATMRAYQATFEGWCRNVYSSITSRCDGRSPDAAPFYEGLPYCSWEEFWTWAQMHQEEWEKCMAQYRRTGEKKDRPSVDRQCSTIGYEPSNLRFISISYNSSRAQINRWHGVSV